jgi:hypothetical protein
VFSQPMTPESRAEAEQALASAKEHAQRNQVAPYFDLSKPHQMIPVGDLKLTKSDPESSYQNAIKRMDTAARGGMDKRKPLTAQRNPDGSLSLIDGHATLEALKRKGISHAPVDVQPAPEGRWIATVSHPVHGLVTVPITAHSTDAARRAAELSNAGTVQSLKAHSRGAADIERAEKQTRDITRRKTT